MNMQVQVLLPKEKDNMVTIADQVASTWISKAEFADELGVGVNNLNQILQSGPEKKKFPKPGPQYMQRIDGKNRYNPSYVSLVKASRKDALVKKTGVKIIPSPDLTSLSVSVYKSQLAVLASIGVAETQIQQKLKQTFDDIYQRVSSKLAELKNQIEL